MPGKRRLPRPALPGGDHDHLHPPKPPLSRYHPARRHCFRRNAPTLLPHTKYARYFAYLYYIWHDEGSPGREKIARQLRAQAIGAADGGFEA
jgi:hypothetical protein